MANLPYDTYPKVIAAITKISQGMTETRACDEARCSIATLKAAIAADTRIHDMYVEAVQRGNDAMADALLQPDNHALYGSTNPQMAKVISDNIKWVLARRDAKRFGDKIEIKHEITLDRAITDALDRAKNRAFSGRTIEHDPEPVLAIATHVTDNLIVVLTEDDEIMAELLG